jgi:hypothetical protein
MRDFQDKDQDVLEVRKEQFPAPQEECLTQKLRNYVGGVSSSTPSVRSLSETPRVDKLLLEINEGRVYENDGPIADLARELERELNEASHRNDLLEAKAWCFDEDFTVYEENGTFYIGIRGSRPLYGRHETEEEAILSAYSQANKSNT